MEINAMDAINILQRRSERASKDAAAEPSTLSKPSTLSEPSP
jgi:hypothetical protein